MDAVATMLKYENYTDSGQTWIGSVPENWEVTKLGACLKAISIKNRPDLPLLSITRELGVIERDIEDQDSNHNFIPDDLSGYKLLKEGQFGMNKMKAWQGSYGVSNFTGIVSPAYFIFDFTKPIEPRFFNWAIRCKLYVSYFGSASDGVRIGQWDLSKDRMKVIPFLLPSPKEQIAIANFLDNKTTQIDEAIAIKERQIALLKERKQIIIQKAVTQGLNPNNVPMKDSGVDWVGQIPEHWKLKKLRFLGRTQNGISAGAEYFGEGYPFVSYGDVYKNRQLPVAVKGLAKSSVSDQELYSARSGDVFFTRTSETIDEIGFASICFKNIEKSTFAGFLIRFRPTSSRLTKEFSKYYFNAAMMREYFVKEMNLVIRASLGQELLKNLLVALPPVDEQLEIFKYLEEMSMDIDSAIDIQHKQIEKLKEYKTTLINSAVTGKVKVA
jgi:type I restriction enzyme S subunit